MIFDANTAGGLGGAVLQSTAFVEVGGSTFSGNSADPGGAFHLTGSTLGVSSSDFLSNSPDDVYNGGSYSFGKGDSFTCDQASCF